MRTSPLPAAPAAGIRAGFAGFRSLLLIPAVAAALGLAACAEEPVTETALASEPAHAAAPDPAKRGEYLVTTIGCNDCHTPWKMGEMGPEPDMSLMLSGHPQEMTLEMPTVSAGWMATISPTFTAFGGPFGVSYSANLTPDPTGLGAITEQMFVQAMRNGKHYGTGRPLLPPMPWTWYRNLTDDDLHAIWAYLQTVPPIQNTVPQPYIMEPPAGM